MRMCFQIGLYKQGLLHDLSKYSWTEFSRGSRYFQGNRSPNNYERELYGYSVSCVAIKDATVIILSTGWITTNISTAE